MKVCLDAGHGGADVGAISQHNGLHEADAVLDIALRVKELLVPYMDVVMTRDEDVFVPLNERARIANSNECDAYLSIHLNSASSDAKGWEVFSSIGQTQGDRLAKCIASRHSETFPNQKVRGIKEASYYVLRHTAMPACLWEGCFLSDEEEADWVSFSDVRQAMAEALSLGIMDFCEIEKEEAALSLEERVARIEDHLNMKN